MQGTSCRVLMFSLSVGALADIYGLQVAAEHNELALADYFDQEHGKDQVEMLPIEEMPLFLSAAGMLSMISAAITARTPSRYVPFAAQSRLLPVPYSAPATTIKLIPSSRYFCAAS